MISLPSSAKNYDKFQKIICHAIENDPERPHGAVSATRPNEPAKRRSNYFVHNSGQRLGTDGICSHEESSALMARAAVPAAVAGMVLMQKKGKERRVSVQLAS